MMPQSSLSARYSALETRQKWRLSHSLARTGIRSPYFSHRCSLPAAELHEVAAKFLLAFVEGRALGAAAGCIGLARVDGREIDFLGCFERPAFDKAFFELVGVEARIV